MEKHRKRAVSLSILLKIKNQKKKKNTKARKMTLVLFSPLTEHLR